MLREKLTAYTPWWWPGVRHRASSDKLISYAKGGYRRIRTVVAANRAAIGEANFTEKLLPTTSTLAIGAT